MSDNKDVNSDVFLGLRKFFSGIGETVTSFSEFLINKFTKKEGSSREVQGEPKENLTLDQEEDSSLAVNQALEFLKKQAALRERAVDEVLEILNKQPLLLEKFIAGTFNKDDKSELLSEEKFNEYKQVFLCSGIDVPPDNSYFYTQNHKLIYAIVNKDFELVINALENGASIEILTKDKDFLHYVANNEELINYFQNEHLLKSIKLNLDSDVLKKELSDFWKAKDGNGNTLLHLACSQDNKATIDELLTIGDIDVASKNDDGKIALELIEDTNLQSSICNIVLEKEIINRRALDLPRLHSVTKSRITKKLLEFETLLIIKTILEIIGSNHIDKVTSLINSHNEGLINAIQSKDTISAIDGLKNNGSIKVLTENKDILSSISSNTELIRFLNTKYITKFSESKKKELSDFWKAKDGNGNTLLHLACSHGDQDAIKELLKVDDIDVTSINNDGKIALELIEDKNLKSKICDIVLKQKGSRLSIEVLGKIGENISIESISTLDLLIESHHDQKNKLIHAVKNNNVKLAQMALRGDTDNCVQELEKILQNFYEEKENSVFSTQNIQTSIIILDIYLRNKPKSEDGHDFWTKPDKNGNTLLHLACSHGNEGIIKELLKVDDIDFTSKNKDGKIALELIKDRDLKLKICDIVLEKQAALKNRAVSPLFGEDKSKIETKILSKETISLLEKLRSEPHETPDLRESNPDQLKDKSQQTTNSEKIAYFENQKNSPDQRLILAIKDKNYDEVDQALKNGANIYNSYKNIDIKVAQLRGENPFPDPHEGSMIYDFAEDLYGKNADEVSKKILEKLSSNRTHDQDLISAIARNNIAKAQEAIDNGANINCKVPINDEPKQHFGLFYYACFIAKAENDYGIVNLLLENKVNYFDKEDLEDDSGISKMIADLRKNRCEITTFLNQKNGDGNTPLHLACIGNKTKTAKQLIEAGADPTIRNNQDQQAIDLTENLELKSFLSNELLMVTKKLLSLRPNSSQPNPTLSADSGSLFEAIKPLSDEEQR
jgi:ankyrin repeat protein